MKRKIVHEEPMLTGIFRIDSKGNSELLYTEAYVEEKDKEIDRLNNIINELEKDLITIREKTFTKYHANEWDNCLSFNEDIKPMLDKVKALKENNK